MPNLLYSQLFVTPTLPTTSFTNQTIIVTGANIGLGLEAARHFVRLDAAKVILAVRSIERGNAAKEDIESTTQRKNVVEVWPLDLASYASVQAFAKRAASDLPRLDAAVLNAGIAVSKFTMAEDNESTITVNVVSTFLLTLLLIPVLRKSGKKHNTVPRLTIVTSEVHGWTQLPERNSPNTFDTLNDEKKANMPERYPASKLLEVFSVRELAGLITSSSSSGSGERDVILNMLNPGLCHSSLSRNATGFQGVIFWLMKTLLARTTEVGGRTLVAAAVAGSESHGKYMSDGKVMDPEGLSPLVKGPEGEKIQKKVWGELVEKLERIQPGVLESSLKGSI